MKADLAAQYLKKNYGYDVPMKGTYKRNPNRIYSILDFKDREHVIFEDVCGKPSSSAKGMCYYSGENRDLRLINYKEVSREQ